MRALIGRGLRHILLESPRARWLLYWSTNFQNGHRAIFYVSGEKKKENAFALIITW